VWNVCCCVEHEALFAVCDQWKEFEAVVVRESFCFWLEELAALMAFSINSAVA
jgi:hypothetical protein